MTRALVTCALAASTLLTVAACSTTDPVAAQPPAPPATPAPRSVPKAAPSTPATTPALTEAQAQAALITEADLGEPWMPTQGAATWRDGFLKATTSAPDCRRLLDALYADDLLGAPARAAIGLDDGYDDAQLRYQVSAGRPADVDRVVAWMKTLPAACPSFKASGPRGEPRTVEVYDAPLPEVGDVRQGLRIAVTREVNGEPVTLTLDVAAVRVGEDAFTLTNGGLGEVYTEITQAAVELGAERLADVRKQGRVQI
ncbi:hypothetical protein ACIQAC_09955 [Streptomyces sp. NPDC088387]|uniref:hypothetical protein n=1 Tax=Streptomyces sp. NPDC088387 TaxID=3365859 RepID=UPI00380019F2